MTRPLRPLPTAAYLTYEEYNQAEQANAAAIAALIYLYLSPYVGVPLTNIQWVELLKFLYPQIEYYRSQSAALARRFYDSERAKFLTDAGVVNLDTFRPSVLQARHPVFLANYRLEFFVEDMEPVRLKFITRTTGNAGLAETIAVAVKQVQNGGRRTQIDAVRTDPLRPRFARVEGGGSSCAFCLMLISRGPVYHSADSAGAAEIIDDFTGDETVLNGLMNRWHPNCDCRVVPVFDEKSWPGRAKFKEAERLWISSTRGHSGNDAINAFRRAVEGRSAPAVPQAA